MEQRHHNFKERVFACPSEAKAGQGDANLGNGKQLFRLCEQCQCCPGTRAAFIRQMAQPGVTHGEECCLRCSEKAVDGQNEAHDGKARNVIGWGHA